MPSVYDRRTKSSPADGIEEPYRGTAHRDRTDSQSADRKAESNGCAAERQDQAEGRSANGHNAARETRDRDDSDRYVADGEDAPRNFRAHRLRIHPGADVYQRPAADGDARFVLKSDDLASLDARAAHEARCLAAHTFAADALLTQGTNPTAAVRS